MAILCVVIQLYTLVIVARAVLSWFPADGGALGTAHHVVNTLTEPVLGPLRRVLPLVRLGGLGIDLAPIVAIVALWLLAGIICR
ncbi:MAG: YggT family protein [Acidimicrobiales bacterium]|nr:YggT family protein [Acidimicrobiales bacterium]